ncbi:MAG: transporter associated domain-containing protein, partial [Smithella sp.]
KLYRKISEGRYLVSGRLEMGTLRQLIKTVFPEGNYETVGGFLMQQMGRIPKPKERFQYGGITFIIENADQKSIKEVMVIAPVQ